MGKSATYVLSQHLWFVMRHVDTSSSTVRTLWLEEMVHWFIRVTW